MRRVLLTLLAWAALATAGERELLDAMRSRDAGVRVAAFEKAKALPPGQRFTCMCAILRETDDSYLLSSACSEIGKSGPAALSAIPDLLRVAYAPDPNVRLSAISALGDLGPSAWRVRGLLREIADERNATLASFAEMAVLSIGWPDHPEPDPLADEAWRLEGLRIAAGSSTIAELRAALDHPHFYVRHHACLALAGGGAEGIAVLAERYRNSKGTMRLRALHAIAASGEPAAIPDLLEIVRGQDRLCADIAIQALGVFRAPESEAAIVEAMRDADLARGRAAIEALERIRPGAGAPILRDWLDSADPKRAEIARRLICERSDLAERFLPDLIQVLYTSRRGQVLSALQRLGPRAAEAGPFLIDLSNHWSQKGRLVDYLAPVIRATGARSPLQDPFSSTVRAGELLDALCGDDWLAAGLAARRLGSVGEASEVLGALARGLRHPKSFVVSGCLDALKERGAGAVPVLTEALDQGTLALRDSALQTLTAMGPESASATDAVIRAIEVPELQALAMFWFETVGPPAGAAAPRLMRLYRESEHRAGVGLALASLGAPATGIIPDLIRDLAEEKLGFQPLLALKRFGPLAASAAPAVGRFARECCGDLPTKGLPAMEAIVALTCMGEAGLSETRTLLESGDPALVQTVIRTLYKRPIDAETLQRIYWDVRDSEDATVRNAARNALRRRDVVKTLDDRQLRLLFDAEPAKSKDLAAELVHRAGMPELMELVRSGDVNLRRAALTAIRERKEDAAPALPLLVKRLVDEPDPGLRHSMLQLICELKGKEAQPVVVAYVRKYRSAGPFESGWKRLRSWADLPFLCDLLEDRDERIRALAGKTLRELQPKPDPALRKALFANAIDPKLRSSYVVSLLASWGAETAPVFVELMRSSKSSEYRLAVKTLEGMGADALPALAVALADRRPTVRARAVYLMEKCGVEADEDLAAVLADDVNHEVRSAAVRALARRGAKAARMLVPSLEDEHGDVRSEVWSFCRKNPEAIPLAVPALMRSLNRSALRKDTIERLRQVRDVALPVLRAAANAGDDPQAVLALADLGEVEERTLRPILASDDKEAQLRAVRLTAQLGPEAELSVRSLMPLLDSRDRGLVEATVRTLGCLGVAARPALDRLLAVRHGGLSPLKDVVAVAVTRIEHPPLVLVDLLRAGGSGLDDEVWRALQQGRAASLPELMALAECQDKGIARRAVTLLGDLGPAAKKAVPLLEKLSKDSKLGQHANAALAKIRPK